MSPTVYAFDAYGTLFDVHAAVRRHAAELGPDAASVSALWRAKQLEYSWVRALCGRYRDFWALTEEALDVALATFGLSNPGTGDPGPSDPGPSDPGLRGRLLDAFRRCDCYPEVPHVIRDLQQRGHRLAILSNGTPDMLAAAIAAAGLEGCFDAVLSVDPLRAYKTERRVYELVTTAFRCYPEAVSFQSSNRWDIAGATAFGLRTVWINRTSAPDEYRDLPPAATLPSLAGLTDI